MDAAMTHRHARPLPPMAIHRFNMATPYAKGIFSGGMMRLKFDACMQAFLRHTSGAAEFRWPHIIHALRNLRVDTSELPAPVAATHGL